MFWVTPLKRNEARDKDDYQVSGPRMTTIKSFCSFHPDTHPHLPCSFSIEKSRSNTDSPRLTMGLCPDKSIICWQYKWAVAHQKRAETHTLVPTGQSHLTATVLHHRRVLYCIALAREKDKIHNLKYSFYWMRYHFSTTTKSNDSKLQIVYITSSPNFSTMPKQSWLFKILYHQSTLYLSVW